jgi:CBS domain-containing protein
MTTSESGGSTPIAELVEDSVVSVSAEATLEAAADLLAESEIGALVVRGPTGVTGVFSERDLVHAVADRRDLTATTVGEVAHRDLVWCDSTATVVEVAAEMMEHYVRHVLVETDGRFTGIVSARDLLGAYAAADMAID